MDDDVDNICLDYDDDLKDDAAKFSIDGKEREIITPEGFVIRETGVFLTPSECIKLSLDLYLGFPSDTIAAYYLWALDYVAGHVDRSETNKLWFMLKKEHMSYWWPRYSLAHNKGVNTEKVQGLYVRMKIVHACRTVCRMVINEMDGRDWCLFVPRFLEYREIGLQDNGDSDLGQGSGRHGSARNLKE